MRNFLGVSACLLLLLATVPGAIAAPIACPATGTYQDLLNSNAGGGCFITVGGGVSLLFSNFTFTPAGVGTPTAAQVGYFLDDPGTAVGGGPIWGFEFNPGLAVTGTVATPNVIQDILLTYLVVPVGTTIVSDHLLENAAATGAGVGQVTENIMFCLPSDPNNTSGTCRLFPPLLVTTAGPPGLHNDAFFAPWSSLTVSKDISASSGTAGSTATISQVRDAFDIVVVVPEPATYGLVSVAFLLFGSFARRNRAKGSTRTSV
jgi:hypothetical protein